MPFNLQHPKLWSTSAHCRFSSPWPFYYYCFTFLAPANPLLPRSAELQSISYWLLLKQAGQDWLKHRSPRLGAALAYYAVFSLGPLLLIVVAVAGVFFGADAVRNSLEAQFKGLIGENGAQAIHAMIAGASWSAPLIRAGSTSS